MFDNVTYTHMKIMNFSLHLIHIIYINEFYIWFILKKSIINPCMHSSYALMRKQVIKKINLCIRATSSNLSRYLSTVYLITDH